MMSCEHEVGLPSRQGLLSVSLWTHDDRIADNGTKSIDLCTELNLCSLSSLECNLGLFSVGCQRSVGRYVGARRDGARVRDALEDLLALVDLGNLIVQELVAALADLNDLGALDAPS